MDASFTLDPIPGFPAGTTVKLYGERQFPDGLPAPIGAELASATTDSAGHTTFTGLSYDTNYWAYAASTGQRVRFRTDPDPDRAELDPMNERLGSVESSVATNTARVAVLKEAPVRLKDADIGGKGDYTVVEDAAFTAAIAKAKTAFNGVGEIFIDPGKYKLTSTQALDASGIRIRGAGRYASLISFEPSSADRLFELGDPTGVNTRFHVELENFGITGNANTDEAIYLLDKNSRYKLRGLRIINCTGANGAGLGMAAAAASHFSGRITDCEFSANKVGARLRGRAQHTVFDDCLIFNNTSFGIDAESDGTNASIGGRLFIINSQVEKNGNTPDTTASLRIAGIDLTVLRDFYNEQDGTWTGASIIVENDTSVAARQPTAVLVEGGYMIGNSAATKAVILRSVKGFTRRNNIIASFTNAEPVSIEESSPGSVSQVREYEASDITQLADLVAGPVTAQMPVTPATSAIGASGTWYSVAFMLRELRRVTQARVVVATQSGNIEVAIYDSAGNRVATTGSVACPAAGAQAINLASAVYLRPGRKYFAVVSADNATVALDYIANTGTQGLFSALGLIGTGTGATVPLPSTLSLPGAAGSRGYVVAFT